MAGRLVLVVGPSGAGKDALIAAARARLADDPRFVFPRRLVTRPAVPRIEDHDTLSREDFAAGDFALSWEAHGLGYALPRAIDRDLAEGRVVVANVSRRVLGEAAGRFHTAVVLVTADADIRARRLEGRGRESPANVAARLARDPPAAAGAVPPTVTIDNSGVLEAAVAAFLSALERFSR